MALDSATVVSQSILGPKFQIITKELSGGPDESGRRRFRATASSTIIDRAGDEIELQALQQMAEQFRKGITIFIDHDFKHVESAFGLTDGAEIIQRSVDDKGLPVWDLDITGVVNTPNPRAVQLADSIDGGYAKFGASVTAFVRKHARKPNGAMKISGLEAIEASIVGVPENQRSWAQQAAAVVKSFNFKAASEEDDTVDETTATVEEAPVVSKGTEAVSGPEAVISKELDKSAEADHDTGDQPTDDSSADESTPGGQASDQASVSTEPPGAETPETASESTDADPVTEKAYSVDEVRELVGHVKGLVTEIGRLREEIIEKDTKIATYEAQAGALTTEVDEAKQVIKKVMELPLRSKTAGFVEDFKTTHTLFDPEIADYLNKRSKLNAQ